MENGHLLTATPTSKPRNWSPGVESCTVDNLAIVCNHLREAPSVLKKLQIYQEMSLQGRIKRGAWVGWSPPAPPSSTYPHPHPNPNPHSGINGCREQWAHCDLHWYAPYLQYHGQSGVWAKDYGFHCKQHLAQVVRLTGWVGGGGGGERGGGRGAPFVRVSRDVPPCRPL